VSHWLVSAHRVSRRAEGDVRDVAESATFGAAVRAGFLQGVRLLAQCRWGTDCSCSRYTRCLATSRPVQTNEPGVTALSSPPVVPPYRYRHIVARIVAHIVARIVAHIVAHIVGVTTTPVSTIVPVPVPVHTRTDKTKTTSRSKTTYCLYFHA
jgi:hypothetical protein